MRPQATSDTDLFSDRTQVFEADAAAAARRRAGRRTRPCGRRVVVVGTSGCGKSYVAQALAEQLGVPYVCNDAIIWGPNWTPTSKPLRYDRFERATRGEGWTFDGNLGSLRSREDVMILQRADTLVWLDLPRLTVFTQLLRRTVSRAWSQEPLWHENRESWRKAFCSRDSILWWAIRTYPLRRQQYAAIFDDPLWSHLQRIRLTTRREVNQWLEQVHRARN
jgi:adenylate kinase family enzyme